MSVDLRVGFPFFQFSAHGRKFLCAGAARVSRVVQENLRVRHRRPARPDVGDQVGLRGFDALFRKHMFHSADAFGGEQAAVECRRFCGVQLVPQKFHVGGHAFYAHAEKLNSASLQFMPGLDEVTSVRPEAAFVSGYDERACRPGKSGKIFSCLPMGRGVFAQVRVRRWDDIRLYAGFFHV